MGDPTSWSRYVQRHLECPHETDPDALHEWLMSFGARYPHTVLYPTNDNLAWLLSTYRDSLERHYRMYSPDAEAIENVLDKRRLFEACQYVGIDPPTTQFAENAADVQAVAACTNRPLLLKQRTQVGSFTTSKGSLVTEPRELPSRYQQFMAQNRHASAVLQRMPFASWPMLQDYYADAKTGSYMVSGFVNRAHTRIVTQAATKLLQYPRTLGIALCLESAPVSQDTIDQLMALCRKTGFYGVFQVEFLVSAGRRMLNDFNPRFYHYMGYDIARGVPLSWLAYLGACGEEARLAEEMTQISRAMKPTDPLVFTCRLKLNEMIWAQRATGTMSHKDFRHWRSWYQCNRDRIVDGLADPEDRKPEWGAAVASTFYNLRHPRAFVRKIALDRTAP